jgi:hypothetical protein
VHSGAFVLAFGLWNFCQQPTAMADSITMNNGAGNLFTPGPAIKHERVLSFPSDYSLGMITLEAYPPAARAPEQRLAARGKVVVPPGKIVRFAPSHRLLINPGIIDKLPPDGIDVLELSASSMDDSEDGLCDKTLAKVGHLKGLVVLDLDRSDASDVGMAHACELPNLQKLSAFSTTMQGKCLEQISTLKQLRRMRLSHNSIGDDNLRFLSALPHLEVIDVIACNVGDAGLKNLSRCAELVSLTVADNAKITDQSVKYLASLKKLKFLGLRRTAITVNGLLQLKGLNLKSIELPSSSTSAAELALMRKTFPKTLVLVPIAPGKKVDVDTKAIFSPLH